MPRVKTHRPVIQAHALVIRHNPFDNYKYLILSTEPLNYLYNATFTIIGEQVTKDNVLVQAKTYDYDFSGYGCESSRRIIQYPHTGEVEDLTEILKKYNIINNDYSIKEYNDIIKNYIIPNNLKDNNNISYQNEYYAWSVEFKKWVKIRCTRQSNPYTEQVDNTLSIPDIIKQELCIIHNNTGIPICCHECTNPILYACDLHITKDNTRYCNNCY